MIASGQEGPNGDQGNWSPRRASDFCAALLAMAGHDLRQPLQILVGMHGWLDHRLTGDSEREYLRRGGLAIARLTDQINHLVDALRLYQHGPSVELAPVPLAPVFAGLLGDNIDFARSRGVELRVCRTSRTAVSEATLLTAILRNLVHNAVKYTPAGKRVVVGCRARRDETSIEVHDSGIGIPAGQLSRVFDAFHRIDSTRADGLGLGLFVVKHIADQLGHALDVRSEIGRGSCFAVRASAANAGFRRGVPS
jgi:signal transduction histidine kinase